MNPLNLCITLYGSIVYLKLFVNIISSCALIILSAILLSKSNWRDVSHVYIGMIVVGILCLFYICKRLGYDSTNKLYDLPILYPLLWSVYATVRLSHIIDVYDIWLLSLSYVVSILNLFTLRFPYGTDGDIRT